MGKFLYSSCAQMVMKAMIFHKCKGTVRDCEPFPSRAKCLRHRDKSRYRQVAIRIGTKLDPKDPLHLMRRAIDSPQGRHLYSQRIGTVEPVFANLRHNKQLNRFTVRGTIKVNTQWNLYCLVHNIEKMAPSIR